MPATLDISQQINRLAEELENALTEAVNRLDSAGKTLEEKLYVALLEWLGELEKQDGKVLNNIANIRRINQITGVFAKFREGVVYRELIYLPAAYLSFADLASAYFEEMQLGPPARLRSIAGNNSLIYATLGWTSDGITPDGYLDMIFRMASVQDRAKRFIRATMTGEPSFKNFCTALKEFIVGAEDSSGGVLTNGRDGFFRQYAYDTFNAIHELKNEEYAQALELPAFLYAGSIIDTTRKFCFDKVGKVFTVEEALRDWPKDPNLVGKNRPEPYYPLIDLGRWACRHFKKYLSWAMYEQLKESEQ